MIQTRIQCRATHRILGRRTHRAHGPERLAEFAVVLPPRLPQDVEDHALILIADLDHAQHHTAHDHDLLPDVDAETHTLLHLPDEQDLPLEAGHLQHQATGDVAEHAAHHTAPTVALPLGHDALLYPSAHLVDGTAHQREDPTAATARP